MKASFDRAVVGSRVKCDVEDELLGDVAAGGGKLRTGFSLARYHFFRPFCEGWSCVLLSFVSSQLNDGV